MLLTLLCPLNLSKVKLKDLRDLEFCKSFVNFVKFCVVHVRLMQTTLPNQKVGLKSKLLMFSDGVKCLFAPCTLGQTFFIIYLNLALICSQINNWDRDNLSCCDKSSVSVTLHDEERVEALPLPLSVQIITISVLVSPLSFLNAELQYYGLPIR